MDSFGERLQSERESRGLSIEAVAQILGVEHGLLLALERNDYQALPSEATMLKCLHGYADCLDVDAGLMIEDYTQDRAKFLLATGAVEHSLETPPALVTPPEFSPAARRSEGPEPVASTEGPDDSGGSSVRLLGPLVVAIALVVLITAAWMLTRGGRAPVAEPERVASAPNVAGSPEGRDMDVASSQEAPRPPSESSAAPTATVPSAVASAAAELPPGERPKAISLPQDPPDQDRSTEDPLPKDRPLSDAGASKTEVGLQQTVSTAAPAESSVSVSEYGVGTGVQDLRLVGQGSRFAEGTRVAFWNRVVGAAAEERIEHVWFHEGVEASRTSLTIGASSWRTHSTKTLFQGSLGRWSVEARDSSGRILARREFVCVR